MLQIIMLPLTVLPMDSNTSSLAVTSHNTTGWTDDKAEILNTVYSSHDISIGFIQEHFQLSPNIYKIQNKFDNYIVFTIPAHKGNEHIHKGRPSGGLAILCHKRIQNLVEHITVPNSNRVHGVSVNLPSGKLIFINVYFPTDPRTVNFNDAELIQTIQDINYISNNFDNAHNVILVGDFNTDLRRNSAFVNLVKQFLSENDLSTIWCKFPVDFTYCQNVCRNGQLQCVTSTIDHFFVKEHFLENCVDGSVLHFAENMSNHEIIYLKINCALEKPDNEIEIPIQNNIPNWKFASQDQLQSFKDDLNEGVNNLNVPEAALCCRNLHCQEEEHLQHIENYTVNLLNVMERSVGTNIPKLLQKPAKKITPGWSDFVEPVRKDLVFWRNVWISAGRPTNCQLHFVYRYVRRQYQYAIRRVKKYEQEIRDDKFIQSAINGDINNILSTLKRQRRTKVHLASSIDSAKGSEEISERFKCVYRDIYNKYDSTEDLNDILNSIQDNITHENRSWLNKITPTLVEKLIKNLNLNKNDQAFSFKSDAFINSAEIMSHPLAQLMKSFLIHGFVPDICLSCTLIPLVKDKKKSKNQSSNYRLIAISSLILKLMDLLILEICKMDLKVSSLQFGFQPKSSTALCSWTLKESINFFINKGSPVYLCLLDMTKAFDNVKLNLLFDKLSQRIPGIFVRFLMFSYMHQKCFVRWGTSKSSSFTIGNGVRQGAIMSPILFNIYMDDIFTILKQSGIGCSIDNLYYGIIGYADDFALLSPTRSGLQKMVDMITDYCNVHGITISTNQDPLKSKTKSICFNYKYQVENIKLYGNALPWVDSHLHLGHTIHKDESTSYDIMRNRGELISNIHSLYQELGSIHPDIFLLLVQVYFTSFYGSVLWDLQCPSAYKLYATWNVMIRNAFELPFATHRYILRILSKRLPLQVSLSNRFRKFCVQIKSSNRPEVLYLYEKQKCDYRSTFGRNYINIILLNTNFGKNYEVPPNSEWKINLIRELIEIKFKSKSLENLSTDEIKTILRNICCT